jgi:hypothetical protein
MGSRGIGAAIPDLCSPNFCCRLFVARIAPIDTRINFHLAAVRSRGKGDAEVLEDRAIRSLGAAWG